MGGSKGDLEKGECTIQFILTWFVPHLLGVGFDATPFKGRFGALSGFPWTLHSSYRSMHTPKRMYINLENASEME